MKRRTPYDSPSDATDEEDTWVYMHERVYDEARWTNIPNTLIRDRSGIHQWIEDGAEANFCTGCQAWKDEVFPMRSWSAMRRWGQFGQCWPCVQKYCDWRDTVNDNKGNTYYVII